VLPFEDRFSRQRRLPEVGEAGQRRIEASSCLVADDTSGRIEEEYLRRAGVRVSFGGGLSRAPAPPWDGEFRSSAASDMAQGAWRALRELRRALGLETERQPQDDGASLG
jgi:hypothetical protein